MENQEKNLPPLRELHGVRLAGFSMGYFGIMLLMMLTESYSYNFYVYTIRLDSILVSIGSTISMAAMAFSGIIFGVMLDNTKPKKIGKRRPYILIGLPLWLISAILVYLPPWIPPETQAMSSTVIYWPTAIWYWGMKLIKAIFGSLLMIVFSSILPEISQTLKNRKKAATVSANLLVLSSIISIAFPNIIQSLVDPTDTGYWTVSGKFILRIMPTVTIIFAIPVTISILIAFFSINESFHFDAPEFRKKKIKDTFKNLFIPVRDKEYMKFMAAGVSTQSSQFMIAFTIIPFIAFVLGKNLLPTQISALFILYIVISISTKFIWLFVWKLIMKKQRNLLKTYKWNMIVMSIASFLELLFLIEMNLPFRLILFILSFGIFLGSMYGTPLFSGPLLNEMVDRAAEMYLINNTQESLSKDQAVTRLSGAYYGLMMFTTSLIGAISSVIYGFIFQGQNSRDPVILTIALMSMGLFQVVALIFLNMYKVRFKEEEF